MAEVYDCETGDIITGGMQGSAVCSEAIQAAQRIAKDRGEPVLLADDDGQWIVHPDGAASPHDETARERRKEMDRFVASIED